MRALHTAATGMMAQELNVEVISNNIANMRTTGYKRQRAEFQDLLYDTQRRMGSATSDQGTVVPAGIQIGSGVRTASTPRIMSQGDMTQTSKDLDVGIRGEGFFRIQMPDGSTSYTRDGSFERDATGTLVTADGYTVDPGIAIPENAQGISINNQGSVSGTVNGTLTTFGQIQLSQFANKTGLEAVGDNLFKETAASGAPQTSTAGTDGLGTILQGYVESANVESVSEISDLIAAQRAYEMNSKVISAADEMLQSTSTMFR